MLSQPQAATKSAQLRQFLESPESASILQRWLHPFQPASDSARNQAKADFTAKTSSAALVHPEAEDIKDDVAWLVKETRLDELSALRIALLERVGRPAALLQHGSRDDQLAALQTSMAQTTNLAASFAASVRDPAPLETADADAASFHSPAARRPRLLRVYLDESLHIVRVGDLLRRLDMKEEGFLLGDDSA
ncbi:MAG: hypothetical protein INR71_06685, partial [Terriglobus roseus]|nr:hypothetical protein [Terriglobus roseus]